MGIDDDDGGETEASQHSSRCYDGNDAPRRHAVLGINEIDDGAAAGPLIGQINDLSKAEEGSRPDSCDRRP